MLTCEAWVQVVHSAIGEEGELSAGALHSQKRAKNGASSKVWAVHAPPATDQIQAGKLTVVYAINPLFSVARRYFRWNGDTLKMFILS